MIKTNTVKRIYSYSHQLKIPFAGYPIQMIWGLGFKIEKLDRKLDSGGYFWKVDTSLIAN